MIKRNNILLPLIFVFLFFSSEALNPSTSFVSEQDYFVKVSGKVVDTHGEPIEGVDVIIDTDLIEYPRSKTTDKNGHYSFGFLQAGYVYEMYASKDENQARSVSTLDYVFIIRHMLGLEEHLDHPYKIIAADTNADNKLTSLDLKHFRKVIIGVMPKFPKTETMRFLDADYDFPDPKNPWPDVNGYPYVIKFKPSQDVAFGFVGI